MREYEFMRLLAGIGSVIALIDTIIGIDYRTYDSTRITLLIVSLILSIVVLLSVIKPNDPVPMNWVLYIALGILILIFSSLAGGILILIAGFIGYTVTA